MRQYIADLEERLREAVVEKDEWKEKARNLANNYMTALKDLKYGLYKVKKDSEHSIKEAKNEF